MKIIVLSVTKYKEKDAIINAISENGFVALTAKGILDPKCKNNELNNILTYVDVDFIEGEYKYPLIKRHKVLISSACNNDYYYLSTLMLLSESAMNLLDEEERGQIFNHTLQALEALKSGVNYLIVSLIYLSRIICLAGYELEINRCVYCGKKENIVAFSFEDGGFICKNCANETTKNDLNKNQLLLLRACFLAKEFSLPEKLFNKEDGIYLINKFGEFIYDGIGYKLNNIQLLTK